MQRHSFRGHLVASLAFILATLPHPQRVEAANNSIILATTTSTRDSGLLDVLVPFFQKKTGFIVKTIAVGTGKALAMGRRGDADILITHAPASEMPLVKEGWLIRRVQFMHNDFIIVGPSKDPARVRKAKDAPGALGRVAKHRVTFLSRGDDSGTHKKEKAIWKAAGVAPKGKWYVESGQGMAATLRIASEKNGYTLTDRATYLHLRSSLASKILFQGDPSLLNRYSVMLVNPARHPNVNIEAAKAFHAWLLGEEARELIRNFGKNRFGQPLFFLDPIE